MNTKLEQKIYLRMWRRRNRERMKKYNKYSAEKYERMKKWRAENVEYYRIYQKLYQRRYNKKWKKRYFKLHPEKKDQYLEIARLNANKWYWANRNRALEYSKEYKRNHK